MLDHAKKRVRQLMKEGGLSQGDAINKVADEEGIPPVTLENSLKAKRHSERRAARGFRGAVSKHRREIKPPECPKNRGGSNHHCLPLVMCLHAVMTGGEDE